MTKRTEMVHVRMDPALKAEATAALTAMGLSASDAVRNETTLRAMAEATFC